MDRYPIAVADLHKGKDDLVDRLRCHRLMAYLPISRFYDG